MSYSVKGNTITLTRGDTFGATLEILRPDGSEYIPKDGDRIRFAMKAKVSDENPLILKEIPISTMMLLLRPEDTKDLAFGTYFYDVELRKSNGAVSTFITKSKINITEEVY